MNGYCEARPSTNINSEQLQKDGNLREDVYVRDTSDQPKSWEDIKQGIRHTLHPDLKADSDKPKNEK